MQDAKPDPPVVQLLGWLEAPPSDAAYEITGATADGEAGVLRATPIAGKGTQLWYTAQEHEHVLWQTVANDSRDLGILTLPSPLTRPPRSHLPGLQV